MPFARPTLKQLADSASADIAANLPGSDPLLRYAVLRVLAKVVAGFANLFYGYLDWIAKQSNPWTATGESLAAWGALKNVFIKPPQAASGQIAFTAAAGSAIPYGTPIQRSDGVAYISAAANVVAGVITVQAAAVVGGAAGNCAAGVTFVLGQPVAGVQSNGAAVGAGFTGGADLETEDAFRGRVLEAYANPPQGGDPADYVTWALKVPGVTRAWVQPLANGAGTVTVYTMFDQAEAAFGGFPQGANGVATNETRAGAPAAATGDQLAVANWIFPLRPVTALVTSAAPTAAPVAFTIAGTGGTWSAALQAAVQAAITNVFLQYASPGGTVNSQGAPNPPVDLSYIEAAIAGIAGTAGFVITSVTCPHGVVTPGGDGNIQANAGYLCTLGVVTFAA